VVVDAQHMADGAVATVKLPFRLNQGIHGWWVADNP
jgi:carotenoid cleavage dioxygenase-like enzyme